MIWTLFLLLIFALAVVYFFRKKMEKPPPPPLVESYVCDICGQEDCLCRKEGVDFEV